MDFIEVEIINWDKYNPRTDRTNMVWFRFQNDFFSSQKLWGLSDSARVTLLFLLCEASKRQKPAISLKPHYVCTLRQRTEKLILQDIQDLIDCGVIRWASANLRQPLAGIEPDKGLATNKQTNKHTHTLAPQAAGVHPLANLWNKTITKLRSVKKTEGKRRALCEKVFKNRDEAAWVEVFKKADHSKFLTGGGGRGWVASFDWVLKNADRVEEGEFDDKGRALNPLSEVLVV